MGVPEGSSSLSPDLKDTVPIMPVKSPVDEVTKFPLAAQIPLKDFALPEFPPEASHLRELTLTADIKMDEYQELLKSSGGGDGGKRDGDDLKLPTLPQSITHLTLELFGLGFPGGDWWLTKLARALPNVRSVTFFSCLVDGLDDDARDDAVKFFKHLPLLNELHVIDSFARPGFFSSIAKDFARRADEGDDAGLKVVDVSYTFRGHDDSDFLARVQGEELAGLIVKGIVGAGFAFLPEVKDELAEDANGENGKIAEGILPFASDGRAPTALRKRFEHLSAKGDLKALRVLNLGMWSLRASEVGEILYAAAGGGDPGLIDLTVSVLIEDDWFEQLVDGCEHKGVGASLEGIEIIGVPAKAGQEGEDWRQSTKLVDENALEKLSKACPKLNKFEMSFLKVKSAPTATFVREAGSWSKA